MRRSSLAVISIAVALVGSGCRSAAPPWPDTGASEIASSATSSAVAPTTPPQPETLVRVTIAGGTVDPSNAEATAVAGQPITLEVNSDAPDSIHVHSVPDHVFDVQARPGQRFEFTVEVPGRVDVELHDLNRTIVTITVRPR